MAGVLVAETDRDCRECYQRFLSRHGYDVRTAANGLECVAKLRLSVPDLLFLDLHLLWGGGDGVLQIMREEPRPFDIPVVLMANMTSWRDLDCLATPPVVRTLIKPVPLSSLLERAARESVSAALQIRPGKMKKAWPDFVKEQR